MVNGNDSWPTAIDLSDDRLDESAGGRHRRTLSAVDSNPGDSHTYTLVGGTGSDDNGASRISGRLQTNALLDYEASGIYSVRVRGGDLAGAGFEQVFLIYLNDVPAPTQIRETRMAHCSGNPIADRRQRQQSCTTRAGRIDNVAVSDEETFDIAR